MSLGAMYPSEVAYRAVFPVVVGSGIVSRGHAGKLQVDHGAPVHAGLRSGQDSS